MEIVFNDQHPENKEIVYCTGKCPCPGIQNVVGSPSVFLVTCPKGFKWNKEYFVRNRVNHLRIHVKGHIENQKENQKKEEKLGTG
jgi:hypothetical protein